MENKMIQLEIPANTYIKYYMKKKGYPLKTPCNGEGICAECLIRVCKGDLPATLRDIQRLDDKAIARGYRLGCNAVSITPITIEFSTAEIKGYGKPKKRLFTFFHKG